jgi:hypothetical protein
MMRCWFNSFSAAAGEVSLQGLVGKENGDLDR